VAVKAIATNKVIATKPIPPRGTSPAKAMPKKQALQKILNLRKLLMAMKAHDGLAAAADAVGAARAGDVAETLKVSLAKKPLQKILKLQHLTLMPRPKP